MNFNNNAVWSCRAGNMLWTSLPPSLKIRSGTRVSAGDGGFVTGNIKHLDYGPRYIQLYEVITVNWDHLGLIRREFQNLHETIFSVSIGLSIG